MGFSFDVGVPVITVFIQGLLSFFSPCVLPLIPLYISYLSGGTKTKGEDGKDHYDRKKVLINTVFFVIGISFVFFILGLGASALGSVLKGHQMIFARIGGVLIILFGLYQLGLFGSSKVLGGEHRLQFKINTLAMSPWTALIMGVTFSFAWTPCVGPALTSVLLMAASADTKFLGFALIGVYTLGFVLPFLAVGMFSTVLLDLFKRHANVVKYTAKIGGILMILIGVMMVSGKMNDITGYLAGLQPSKETQEDQKDTETAGNKAEKENPRENEPKGNTSSEKEKNAENGNPESQNENSDELMEAIDFELKDQYGEVHKLSDYKGKTIFLNFWATWCPPCREEMPDIQKLYESYQAEEDPKVVILGIAAPGYGQEQDEEGVKKFLRDNGYTYPVLMNTGGDLFEQYGIYSFPTTFMIDSEGKVFGYESIIKVVGNE